MSLLVLSFAFSCGEEEPETACYECERIIQTFDSEDILFLRQEEIYSLCNRTKEEITTFELENTYEENKENGTRQERFTSCVRSTDN